MTEVFTMTEAFTMTEVWIGALIAVAGLAGLLLRRVFGGSGSRRIDVGTVSQAWLSEERTGKRDRDSS